MALTGEQIAYIQSLDSKGTDLLSEKGKEGLLLTPVLTSSVSHVC